MSISILPNTGEAENYKEPRKREVFFHRRGNKGLIKSTTKLKTVLWKLSRDPRLPPFFLIPRATHYPSWMISTLSWRSNKLNFNSLLPLDVPRILSSFSSSPFLSVQRIISDTEIRGLKEARRPKNRRCSRKCSSSKRDSWTQSHTRLHHMFLLFSFFSSSFKIKISYFHDHHIVYSSMPLYGLSKKWPLVLRHEVCS